MVIVPISMICIHLLHCINWSGGGHGTGVTFSMSGSLSMSSIKLCRGLSVISTGLLMLTVPRARGLGAGGGGANTLSLNQGTCGFDVLRKLLLLGLLIYKMSINTNAFLSK